MPRRFVKNHEDFANVVADGTATITLERDAIYHGLRLIHLFGGSPARATEAQLGTNLEDIEISINGTEQRQASATEIIGIHKWKGGTITDGELPLDFALNELRTFAGENEPSWGTGDMASFQIAVKLGAGITNPSLGIRRLVSPGVAPVGEIVTWRRQSVEVTAAGIKRATVESEREMAHIHCFSDQINSVKVQRGDTVLYEGDKWMFDSEYVKKGYVPQSNIFTISAQAFTATADERFNLRNPATGKKQPLKIEFDMATAAGFDMIIEEYGPRKV